MAIRLAWQALILGVVLGSALPMPAEARAFCSLRDPISAIRQLFPDTSGFLSTVRVINADARSKVATMLPFTIHYNELGKHTLYTALDEKYPLGFVHVRSETGPWGLMEVAWALTPELAIRDLSFQRCRSSVCNEPMRADLSRLVGGLSWVQLADLLELDGTALKPELQSKYEDNSAFVLAIIKSAMKTALVTETSWPQEVARVMAIHLSQSSKVPVVQPALVRKHNVPAAAVAALRERNGGLAVSAPEQIAVFALHADSVKRGWLITNQWEWNGQVGNSYWLFSATGEVEGVKSVPAWPSGSMASAFRDVLGRRLSQRQDCETSVELMANELFSLASVSLEAP